MTGKPRARLVILHVLVISLFVVLLGRLWSLQVLNGDRYAHAATANRTRDVIVPAPRGWILDSVGRPLVRNRSDLVVSVNRQKLLSLPGDGEKVLRRLADVLHVSERHIRRKMRLCGEGVGRPCWAGSPYQPIPIDEHATNRQALEIMERPEDFPAVTAQVQPVRTYPRPDDVNAAHILGHLGPITDRELRRERKQGRMLTTTALVGRDGLESEYDKYLRGESGVQTLTVNSRGVVTGTARKKPPTPGATLVTSINADVQHDLEQALLHAEQRARGTYGLPGDAAAGVVLDVRTGRVIAAASLPTYDPVVWVGGISQRQYERLTSESANNPLLFRATQGQAPPGSTFKPVSTAAAAKAGYPLDGSYDCSSAVQVGTRTFHNFGGYDLGPMNLHQALVVSCDTIYYRIAYQMWQRDGGAIPVKHPRQPIPTMAKHFGLGKPTGIDLPQESDGRIPGRQWKRAYWEETKDYYCKHAKTGFPDVAKTDPARARFLTELSEDNCVRGYVWRGGDAVNLAIGQGDVLVTPLQLARAYAAIANGGTVFSPRIGKAVISPGGKVTKRITPPKDGRLPVSKQVLSYIRDALADVPVSGTAAGAFAGFPFDQVRVAGKTGTAQVYGEKDTSWFASYAPADHPRYAAVVMVSQAGQGAHVAAPAVREVWDGIFGLEGHQAALPHGAPPDKLPRLKHDGTFKAPPGFGPSTRGGAPSRPHARAPAGTSALPPDPRRGGTT